MQPDPRRAVAPAWNRATRGSQAGQALTETEVTDSTGEPTVDPFEVLDIGMTSSTETPRDAPSGGRPVKRCRRTDLQLAEVDEAIVAAVEQDHPVTLRGVYYRVVSAGAVDKTENGYRLVGRELIKLRRCGAIPYTRITDGTRWISKPTTWSSIDEMLDNAASSYRRALWHDTDDEVMFFTEKDAISGVVLPITARWDVPLGVLRGYCSESFAHSVAEDTIASNSRRVGTTYVYQLGDHDPSGVDAWRDFTEKVTGFLARRDDLDGYVLFERLAVTEEQVVSLELPTRPTKKKDTRSKNFVGGSVEVDAIPAPILRTIVDDAITQHIDQQQLAVTRTAELSERELFTALVDREFVR